MNSSYNIIIFIKNPIEGRVKTRLAASIGNKQALRVYEKLLDKTRAITINLKVNKTVFYDEKIITDDIWESSKYKKKVQRGNDLGDRMKNAFEESFKEGYEKTLIIGSDCFDINEEIIAEAFESLDENDLVVGPSEDGGYYLLGMNKMHKFLFHDMPWSQEGLLELTISKIKKNRLSFRLLQELNDIDTVEDLEKSNIKV